MIRNILAVIAGYIAMFIVVFVSFSAAFLILGTDRTFAAGSYEPSMMWIVISFVLGLIAAVVGGIVCAKISKHSKGAVLSLIVVVLVLGALSAATVVMRAAPEDPADLIRTGDVSNTDAMMRAQQPVWVAIANPIVGAVGVMLGAMLVCPKLKSSDAE